MASVKYTYSVADDTAEGQVNFERLENEIRDSGVTIALDYIEISEDDLDIWFKDSLSSPEELELDQVVEAHTGAPVAEPRNADGIPLVSLHGNANEVQVVGRQDGTDLIRASHNLCDPCTWYHQSKRTTETLTNPSGDDVTFESQNSNLIDLTHGRIHSEDKIRAAESSGHGYGVVVRVDGVEQTPRPPFSNSGGDYEVDYEAGTVTFFSAVTGTVEADYSYEDGSEWVLQPEPGKIIEINSAEAQFSSNCDIKDTIHFIIEVPDGQGGYITVGSQLYQTYGQFVDEARGAYPVIPPLPGDRGSSSEIYGFPFQYSAVRLLKSSLGMRLRIGLDNDQAFTGDRCTTTFYTTSYDEDA